MSERQESANGRGRAEANPSRTGVTGSGAQGRDGAPEAPRLPEACPGWRRPPRVHATGTSRWRNTRGGSASQLHRHIIRCSLLGGRAVQPGVGADRGRRGGGVRRWSRGRSTLIVRLRYFTRVDRFLRARVSGWPVRKNWGKLGKASYTANRLAPDHKSSKRGAPAIASSARRRRMCGLGQSGLASRKPTISEKCADCPDASELQPEDDLREELVLRSRRSSSGWS